MTERKERPKEAGDSLREIDAPEYKRVKSSDEASMIQNDEVYFAVVVDPKFTDEPVFVALRRGYVEKHEYFRAMTERFAESERGRTPEDPIRVEAPPGVDPDIVPDLLLEDDASWKKLRAWALMDIVRLADAWSMREELDRACERLNKKIRRDHSGGEDYLLGFSLAAALRDCPEHLVRRVFADVHPAFALEIRDGDRECLVPWGNLRELLAYWKSARLLNQDVVLSLSRLLVEATRRDWFERPPSAREALRAAEVLFSALAKCHAHPFRGLFMRRWAKPWLTEDVLPRLEGDASEFVVDLLTRVDPSIETFEVAGIDPAVAVSLEFNGAIALPVFKPPPFLEPSKGDAAADVALFVSSEVLNRAFLDEGSSTLLIGGIRHRVVVDTSDKNYRLTIASEDEAALSKRLVVHQYPAPSHAHSTTSACKIRLGLGTGVVRWKDNAVEVPWEDQDATLEAIQEGDDDAPWREYAPGLAFFLRFSYVEREGIPGEGEAFDVSGDAFEAWSRRVFAYGRDWARDHRGKVDGTLHLVSPL
jgi:hypothetical protein